MSIFRTLLVLGLLGLGVHWWQTHREAQVMQRLTSPNGFLPVPMPEGTPPNTVLVFAPLNCPEEGAQRAEALSRRLTELGIRNVRTAEYASTSFTPSEEQVQRFKQLNKVMTGEIPIALVNGMGKANPTVDEVVAEYQRTR